MKILFIILFIVIVFPLVSNAQLCVIYDKDGYTNVRENTSLKSKIIGKIVEGQVFAIAAYTQEQENDSKIWVAVSFPTSKNLKVKNFLKFEGNKEITGYVHKSRLVELDILPTFRTKEIDANAVIHSYKNVEIRIETQVFKKSEHKIIQTKEGKYLIDGKSAYPYYGEENISEIKSIAIKSAKNIYNFDKSTFKNLFWVSAANTKVYVGKKEEFYIVFDCGDGADGYNIVYCIKNNKLFSMTTTSVNP